MSDARNMQPVPDFAVVGVDQLRPGDLLLDAQVTARVNRVFIDPDTDEVTIGVSVFHNGQRLADSEIRCTLTDLRIIDLHDITNLE